MGGKRRSGAERGSARYCPSCGTDLEPSTNYCPNCGTATEQSAGGVTTDHSWTAERTDHGDNVTDREVLEYRISMASQEGWELEHDFGDHAVMIKRSFGSASTHLLIALFTIWFTMGIGNALYAGYKYFGDVERMVLRPDRVSRPNPSPTADSTAAYADATANGDTASTGSASVKRIFTVGLLWLFGLALLLEGSLLVSGFGLLLFVTGAAMLPSVRRRIRDREPITTTGRTRTVEETDVRSPNEPCTVCHRSMEEGIERTYREEFRLLGVSLVTTDSGVNYYCRTCAGLESEPHDHAGGKTNTDAESTTETGADVESSPANPTEAESDVE